MFSWLGEHHSSLNCAAFSISIPPTKPNTATRGFIEHNELYLTIIDEKALSLKLPSDGTLQQITLPASFILF
jgi:hypothetical protein